MISCVFKEVLVYRLGIRVFVYILKVFMVLWVGTKEFVGDIIKIIERFYEIEGVGRFKED